MSLRSTEPVLRAVSSADAVTIPDAWGRRWCAGQADIALRAMALLCGPEQAGWAAASL